MTIEEKCEILKGWDGFNILYRDNNYDKKMWINLRNGENFEDILRDDYIEIRLVVPSDIFI